MKQPPIIWKSKEVSIDLIDPSPTNYKIASELGRSRFVQSVAEFGRAGTRVVNLAAKGRYVLVDGNNNLLDAKERGERKVWISYPSRRLTDKEFDKMCKVFDWAKAGDSDEGRIVATSNEKAFFKQYGLPVPERLLSDMGKNAKVQLEAKAKTFKPALLSTRFVEPPFSVWDQKTVAWQTRRQEWYDSGVGDQESFDPALTELVYGWFAKKAVFDPTPDEVRKLVAKQMGLKYNVGKPDLIFTTAKRNIVLTTLLPKSFVVLVLEPNESAVDYVEYFKNKGIRLHGKVVLLNMIGTEAMKIDKTFKKDKELAVVHQDVLIFYKS